MHKTRGSTAIMCLNILNSCSLEPKYLLLQPLSAFLLPSEKHVHGSIVLSDLTPVSPCQINAHGAVVVGGKSLQRALPLRQTAITVL